MLLKSVSCASILPDKARFSHLIDAMGTPSFNQQLFDLFDRWCFAEHCGVYQITPSEIDMRGGFSRDGSDMSRRVVNRYLGEGFWENDPAIRFIKEHGSDNAAFAFEIDVVSLTDFSLRNEIFLAQNMRYRLLLCLPQDNGVRVLGLVRSSIHGSFGKDPIPHLGDLISGIIPIVYRHYHLLTQQTYASAGVDLSDVFAVEERIEHFKTHIPKRERQVAARILNGLSTTGIALDLEIAEDTVTTYRKRIYQRLGIATQHELLRWYLSSSIH